MSTSTLRVLSTAVRRELERVSTLPAPWIVADMDSTLIRKERGEYPDLEDSPCRPHLLQWLTSGGKLLVVTSDEGHRPFRQLLGQIPSELRPSVVLAAGEGAALYKHDGTTFVEDDDYEKATTPGLPHPHEAVKIACDIKREFMVSCLHNRTLLEHVQPKSRRLSYSLLLDTVTDAEEFRKTLTQEYMLQMGALPKFRGSMIWRNQSGIPSGWDGNNTNKTNTPTNTPCRWTTMWVLGISDKYSSDFVNKEYREQLSSLGISAELAPNSVLLKNKYCSKALPINYMFHLLQNNAVAFGDNPSGNDSPMTEFQENGLPFFSVSKQISETPAHVKQFFVGGLEKGTALCIEYMNEIRQQQHSSEEGSKM